MKPSAERFTSFAVRRNVPMRNCKGEQSGFVLVLTLWILVVVAIAAGYFSERVALSVDLAQQSRQNTQALIDMASSRAEILYRLGTYSMTEYGLGRGGTAIALDNRAYQGIGKTTVYLQDTRGLLNLNLTDDERLQRFLGVMGVAPDQRSTMVDTLRDYIDSDKLRRLNGAEDDEYRALNLPTPSNRELVTPWEAQRIIGWRDQSQLWQSGKLASLTTTGLSLGINPNTAPAEVLATLPGVSEEIAQIIMARRKLVPFTYEGQITQITGVPLNLPMGMGVIAVPSDTVRITQSGQGLAWATQYIIKVTPNSKDAPWRTDYYSRVSAPAQAPDVTPQALPARSDAAPDNAPNFLLGGN
ncbi:MAG: general secretion pathway protein GspK [Chitinophagaceae bacterium]|nr:general secretion pathway protein GspK [Polaromonas sp.]